MKEALTELLKQVGEAYGHSTIQVHGWQYSLVTGRLEREQPLIVGFNWGVDKAIQHQPQQVIDKNSLSRQDLGSMKRVVSFCEKNSDFLGQGFLENASQTNFCFFRSQSEKEIGKEDLELCQPIFDRLLTLMDPSVILCFSSQARDYLRNTNQLEQVQEKNIVFSRGALSVSCFALRGILNGKKIVFLPHPNLPIPKSVRNGAWQFAFTA